MGGESSKSNSNSSKSDSDSSSNSADKNGILEEISFLKENENTRIKRVWIVKKSICLADVRVGLFEFTDRLEKNFTNKIEFLLNKIPSTYEELNNLALFEPKLNVFKIENRYNFQFKHWAIILELSNGSYVNIQFGRDGFSLRESNKTEVEGESVLNSITETWGEEMCPYSFCYLGNANYKYTNLKNILIKLKDDEAKKFKEKGKTYYNALHNNCHHFVCEIEKILFGSINVWHSFKYYLQEFFATFFPNANINKLKNIHEKQIERKNKMLFKKNVDILKEKYAILSEYEKTKKYEHYCEEKRIDLDITKKYLEREYSLKYDDFLD